MKSSKLHNLCIVNQHDIAKLIIQLTDRWSNLQRWECRRRYRAIRDPTLSSTSVDSRSIVDGRRDTR